MSAVRTRWAVVSGVLAVASVAGLAGLQSAQSHELGRGSDRIAALRPAAAAHRRAVAARVDAETAQSLGVAASRTASDTRLIGSLVSATFTWSSGADYTAARTDLQTRFGLPADSALIRAFVPVSRSAEDYGIDEAGLTSKAATPRITLQGDDRGTDRYTVVVDVTTTSHTSTADGATPVTSTASRTRTDLLHVSVNGRGRIVSADGTQGAGTTRVSEDG